MKNNIKSAELTEQGHATFFGLNLLEDIMKLDPEVKEDREAVLAGRESPVAETFDVELGLMMDEELDVTEEELLDESVVMNAGTPKTMHLDDFTRDAKFVHQKGKRRLSVMTPDGKGIHKFEAQHNGKITKPKEEILKDIHRSSIDSHLRALQNAQLPHATPYEKALKPIPDHIISSHPDLAKRQDEIMKNKALKT